MSQTIGMFSFGMDERIPDEVQSLLVEMGLAKEKKGPVAVFSAQEHPDIALEALKTMVAGINTLIAVFPDDYVSDPTHLKIAKGFSFAAIQSTDRDIFVVKKSGVDIPTEYRLFPSITATDETNWLALLKSEISKRMH